MFNKQYSKKQNVIFASPLSHRRGAGGEVNHFSLTINHLKMKHLVFLLLFAGFISAHAQSNAPYSTKTYSSAVGNVEVSTSGGYIQVSGDASGSASVEIYIRGNNGKDLSNEEIAERLNNYTLETGVTGNTLYARAKSKEGFNSWNKSLSISFKIHVPKNVGTHLTTSGGSITLTGLDGEQKFATSGGSLTVNSVSGNIDGSTSGGSITATDCKGTVGLATSGGSITARDCDGTLGLATSGGSITVRDCAGTVGLATSGGGIDLDGSFEKVDAQTSGGSITATFKKIGTSAKLVTSGGGIRLQLPQSQGLSFDVTGARVSIGAANNIQVDSGTDYAKGSINGGGALVRASTNGGSVKIMFK
jgi:DUF4097 and DUF4098 domain-containing protein YvlB